LKTDGRYTIRAGWVVDGRGRGIQENVLLEIAQGRIYRCDATPGVDGGVSDLDLSDCMLIPGLIDSHVHLFMSGTADAAVREWQLNAPYRPMQAVIEKHLKQQLACGVAAVRDGGDYAGHVEVLAVQILHFAEDGLWGELSALGIIMIGISSSLVIIASLLGNKLTSMEVVNK